MGNYSDIEEDAIDKVSQLLRKTKKIQNHFSANDKTISYDGFFEIFNSQDKIKKNLLGILRVQIKGRTIKKKLRDEYIYEYGQFKKEDLEVYYRENGVMYFLVINPSSDHYKVFYKYLQPTTIKKMLNQKAMKITLAKLDNSKLGDFYLYCLHHLQEKIINRNYPIYR